MFVLMHENHILGYYTDESSAYATAYATCDRYRRMYNDETYCVVEVAVARA